MNTPPMIGSMRPLAAILVLLGVFGGTSGDAFARQPSPVQKRSCDLPEPLRGVTGHVLVRYTVNEAGKVNFVKPLFVVSQPPDRATDLTDVVSTCLRAWAYPASDRQSPGHASVEMIQAFHYFRPAPPGGPSREMEGGRRSPARPSRTR